MKKKKVVITIIISFCVILVSAIVAFKLSSGNLYGIEKSGNLYDNISDFAVLSEETPDELTQAYLESITYKIINFDKEKMMATVEMQVPQISDELSKVLDKIISENKDAEYNELKSLVKKELTNVLKSNRSDKSTNTLIVSVENINGFYQIIPSQEWNDLITGNLEQLYMEYIKTLIGGMTDEIS